MGTFRNLKIFGKTATPLSPARALGTVVGADWEAEYRDAMLATAFEDARYS